MFLSKKLLKQERFYSFRATSNNGVYTTTIYSSFNLVDWTAVSTVSGSASYFKKVNGIYFLIFPAFANNSGNGQKLAYSYNCIDWTEVAILNSCWRDICYGGGYYILIGENVTISTSTTLHKKVLYSSDLVNWYEGTPPTYGGRFLATNGTNQFATDSYGSHTWSGGYSTNGIIWTTQTPYAGARHSGLAYGNGYFAISLQDEPREDGPINESTSKCLISTNGGQSYSVYNLPISTFWGNIIFAKGKFYITLYTFSVGAHNTYYYGDFVNGFVAGSYPNSRRWGNLNFNNGRFFITNTNSSTNNTFIATSIDGVNWEEHETSGLLLSTVL